MKEEKIRAMEEIVEREHGNIAGMVVRKGGKVVYERYRNGYTAGEAVHVFSVTKSVVSLLIGIAIDKGFIEDAEQRVLNWFPEYTIKRGEKTIQKITLRHLLTMTAPFKYKSAPYTRYFTSDDWVRASLDLLGGRKEPGEFRYTPLIGPDILTGILAAATGMPAARFARRYLFSPLEIGEKRDIVFRDKEEQLGFLKARGINGWVADPKGNHTAGWGLTLTPAEMARLGQLCLDGGVWRGRQIVSSAWLAESTREHSRWPALDLPYGYLWWAGVANGYAAMGDGGNMIYVSPKSGMTVAVAASFQPTAKDRVELIEKWIEPAF